jgi:hypothetical protein
MIINGCDEVKSESEAFSSVAVAVGEDVESLKESDDVFDDDTVG